MWDEEVSKWLSDNDLHIVIGECGFGRPCVGVMYARQSYWLGYHDCEVAQESRPTDAYHKDDYLCVLVHNDDYQKAVSQLAGWVNAVVKGSHLLIDKAEEGGLSKILGREARFVKALVNA